MAQPTHAYIDPRGDIHCVYPEGYTNEAIVLLPEDFYTRGWYKWDDDAFVDDLSSWRIHVAKKANVTRDKNLYGGCATPQGDIDTTLESRSMLYNISIESTIVNDPNYTVDITFKDNSTVSCTKEQLDEIMLALRQHDQQAHDTCRSVKNQAEHSNEIIEGLC